MENDKDVSNDGECLLHTTLAELFHDLTNDQVSNNPKKKDKDSRDLTFQVLLSLGFNLFFFIFLSLWSFLSVSWGISVAPTYIMNVCIRKDLEHNLIHRDAQQVADKPKVLLMQLMQIVGVVVDHWREYIGESVNSRDPKTEVHICLEELIVGWDHDEKVEEGKDYADYSQENVDTVFPDLFSHARRD